MIESVLIMIKTFNQLGISSEYRVTNPSKNPAAMVKGTVLKKILKLFLNPIFKEVIREKVCGNRMEAPRINPAADSITIAKISIEP
jgi:hypothetical protein